MSIWPTVAQLEKGRIQVQIHPAPKPVTSHYLDPKGVQV